ncbi:MAG: enoyl-CoA hydratase/isomerase family protein [Gammaproteobacteria bacterium]|nr:enoyl-CoA hydratase/isomerase family protein [Gammaproteobacteria bacterium]
MNGATLVLTEDRGEIRVLSLNRPAALNALSRAMANAIVAALRQAHSDPAVAAVVLTGVGERAFCAGVDLKEAQALTVAEVPAWFTEISECYRQILLVDKPVVVALNGVAAGGGYQMALVADWRIGHPRTRVTQPEINAGLPSIMGAYLMRFYLPLSLNQELSFSGRILHAEECRRLGLLNEIVPALELTETAYAQARALAAKSRVAFVATKARFREEVLAGFESARAAAIAGMQAAYAAGEPQRRMAEFLTKR